MVNFSRREAVEAAKSQSHRGLFLSTLVVAFAVAGCASDKADHRGATGFLGSLLDVFDSNHPEVEPPPADGRAIPNLASVPRPPARISAAERQAEMVRLAPHTEVVVPWKGDAHKAEAMRRAVGFFLDHRPGPR